MPKKSLDRRVQRTRQALTSAFVELVLTRGYAALAAGDICRKADVGRSTFYLHYAGKEQLLAECLRYPSSKMAECVSRDTTSQQLVPLLEHFRDQRDLNPVFFVDPIRSLWVKSLATEIKSRLAAAQRRGGARSYVPPSLLALMIAELQIALVAHWLRGGFALKCELVAAMFLDTTRALLGMDTASEPR